MALHISRSFDAELLLNEGPCTIRGPVGLFRLRDEGGRLEEARDARSCVSRGCHVRFTTESFLPATDQTPCSDLKLNNERQNNNITIIIIMNNFPDFQDGDVRVIISGSRQYQLHSAILKSNSPVFAELLDDENAARLSSKAIKRGVRTRFRIIMVENTSNEHIISHTLQTIPLDENGRPITPQAVPLDLENGRVIPTDILAYDSVLSALYNVPIDLGDAMTNDMADIVSKVSPLVDVAEYLGCVRFLYP